MPASDIYVSWDESVNCVQEMWRGAEFCFVSPVGARASAVLQSAQMAADQYCSAAVLQSETGRELLLMVM